MLAVTYCLSWYLTAGFDDLDPRVLFWDEYWLRLLLPNADTSKLIDWLRLLVPLALLFSTNIWRWIKSGSDD